MARGRRLEEIRGMLMAVLLVMSRVDMVFASLPPGEERVETRLQPDVSEPTLIAFHPPLQIPLYTAARVTPCAASRAASFLRA